MLFRSGEGSPRAVGADVDLLGRSPLLRELLLLLGRRREVVKYVGMGT